MSKHHALAPSQYNAWAMCPLFKGDNRPSQSAKAGTSEHDALSKCISEGADPSSALVEWAFGAVKSLAGDAKLASECLIEGRFGAMSGIYGTVDVIWEDGKVLNIADLKSFSDGSNDYFPQLRGYAATFYDGETDSRVRLHVLHGGAFKVETEERSIKECYEMTEAILTARQNATFGCERVNPWCAYCAGRDKCPAVSGAIQTVGDCSPSFSRLTMCQKLVVLDAVDKLSKSIREEARAAADVNGGAIEDVDSDGNVLIRYELKERAGRAKVDDLCVLASASANPLLLNRSGEEVRAEGLTSDEFIKLCDVSKSALVAAIYEKNGGNPSVKKVDIERWFGGFTSPGTPTKVFTRTK